MPPKVFSLCNARLRRCYRQGDTPRRWVVLEAGGGSVSHFAIPDGTALVVLDISHHQLQRHHGTPLKVQGDVHRLPFKDASIDLAVCFNVLEHLDDPETALRGLLACLRPGGLLLLGCPERASLKGLITRMTPLAFHRFYYRVAAAKRDHGAGHYDAFATPFRPLVSRRRLLPWLHDHGIDILFCHAYDGVAEFNITSTTWKGRLCGIPYYLLGHAATILSLGRWRCLDADLLIIGRKR